MTAVAVPRISSFLQRLVVVARVTAFEPNTVYHQEYEGGDRSYFKAGTKNKNGSWKGQIVESRRPRKVVNGSTTIEGLKWVKTPKADVPAVLAHVVVAAPSSAQQQQVAKTILQQLGGNKFVAMTGATAFSFSADPKGQVCLTMRIGRNAKNVNAVYITLTHADEYAVEFVNVRSVKGSVVKKIVSKADGIHAEQLREVFTSHTGMETSLGTGTAGVGAGRGHNSAGGDRVHPPLNTDRAAAAVKEALNAGKPAPAGERTMTSESMRAKSPPRGAATDRHAQMQGNKDGADILKAIGADKFAAKAGIKNVVKTNAGYPTITFEVKKNENRVARVSVTDMGGDLYNVFFLDAKGAKVAHALSIRATTFAGAFQANTGIDVLSPGSAKPAAPADAKAWVEKAKVGGHTLYVLYKKGAGGKSEVVHGFKDEASANREADKLNGKSKAATAPAPAPKKEAPAPKAGPTKKVAGPKAPPPPPPGVKAPAARSAPDARSGSSHKAKAADALIRPLVDQIKKLTHNNNHSEAGLLLAKFMKNSRVEASLKAFKQAAQTRGLSSAQAKTRDSLVNGLLAEVLAKYGKASHDKLKAAF